MFLDLCLDVFFISKLLLFVLLLDVDGVFFAFLVGLAKLWKDDLLFLLFFYPTPIDADDFLAIPAE